MKAVFLAWLMFLMLSSPSAFAMDLVLSERIMKLSKTAAELSTLAYEENPSNGAYSHFRYYNSEPDQAVVAQYSGYCYGAFRGTTLSWGDWEQNVVMGTDDICYETAGERSCCKTRSGFSNAYNTPYRATLERDLRACAKDCVNKDECIVLTGHSQGGAIAAIAAIHLADLNPHVITFGQPPTIDSPCPLVSSDRWYRYVNTNDVESGSVGIAYDPVPFLPGMGAENYGHMILLSSDTTGVAYIGLDVQDDFRPLDLPKFDAHRMVDKQRVSLSGYLDRIESLTKAYKMQPYPVFAAGYAAGSLCTQDKECLSKTCGKETSVAYQRCIGDICQENRECDSRRCDSGVCAPKLGSCMICDESSDCLHGVCSAQFRCSGQGGLMDIDCSCVSDTDCKTGRCEGIKPRICEAKLGRDAYCNESSDCKSGACSWTFRCIQTGYSWWRSSDSSSIEISTAFHMSWKQIFSEQQSGIPYAAFLMVSIVTLSVLSSWYFGKRRRRRGYESIPPNLSV